LDAVVETGTPTLRHERVRRRGTRRLAPADFVSDAWVRPVACPYSSWRALCQCRTDTAGPGTELFLYHWISDSGGGI
jgi:hypothetical protein